MMRRLHLLGLMVLTVAAAYALSLSGEPREWAPVWLVPVAKTGLAVQMVLLWAAWIGSERRAK